jgi:hypothetical protein
MLWNQQWILAFTSEARKKGKNSTGLLRSRQGETKALFKNNSVQIDLLPPPNAVALWRGIPTLSATAHFS